MKISSIHLQDFRCFEDLKIELNPDTSVFVGVNGAGKTTVLDGIVAPLEIISSSLRNFGRTSWLCASDIRRNQKGGVETSAQLICSLVSGEAITLQLDHGSNSDSEQKSLAIPNSDETEKWRQLGESLRGNPNAKEPIPVFCYYPAQRGLKQLPPVVPDNSPVSRLDSIKEFQDGNESLGQIVNWLHDIQIEGLLLKDQGKDSTHLEKYLNSIQKAIVTALDSVSELRITPEKPRKL